MLYAHVQSLFCSDLPHQANTKTKPNVQTVPAAAKRQHARPSATVLGHALGAPTPTQHTSTSCSPPNQRPNYGPNEPCTYATHDHHHRRTNLLAIACRHATHPQPTDRPFTPTLDVYFLLFFVANLNPLNQTKSRRCSTVTARARVYGVPCAHVCVCVWSPTKKGPNKAMTSV